jgi:citrate synthase
LKRTGHLSASEAAAALGVSRDTLYAYVSRGLLRSERSPGSRASRYHAEDVWMLVQRREGRRDPSRAARQALHWGTPVLESEIALISDGELHYRGWKVSELARTSSFEDVAALLWGDPGGVLPDAAPELPPAFMAVARAVRDLPALEAFQMALAAAAAHDPSAWELAPESVRATGARILRLLAAIAVGASPSRRPVAEVLQRGWASDDAAARAILEAALVLWADHELNVSTFAARCVASANANPYAVVVAGLSALRGPLHGGATAQVEALFDEVGEPARARAVLEARLRRGERIPGFGHALYVGIDPRARVLLDLLHERKPVCPGLALADAVAESCVALVGKHPNVDFAGGAMARALALPRGAPLAMFGIARSAGWIAHALEQYAEGRLIRPRARYVGPPPRT